MVPLQCAQEEVFILYLVIEVGLFRGFVITKIMHRRLIHRSSFSTNLEGDKTRSSTSPLEMPHWNTRHLLGLMSLLHKEGALSDY